MLRLLYSLAWLLALPLVCLRLWGRGRKEPGYRQHWRERFGMYARGAAAASILPQDAGEPPSASAAGETDPAPAASGAETAAGRRQLIWLHAVSVGETRAAEPLLTALLQAYPQATILLTHMTPTGRETGRMLFAKHGARVQQSYLPYDLVWLVRRFLRHFAPSICILMETEVWPNLLLACEQARVPVALVNARLSERSMRRGQKMGALMRDAARRITLVAAQTGLDAERIRTLGASRVEVTGSIKFDVAVPDPMLALGRNLRTYAGTRPVLLCASTREGEEALLLPALCNMLQTASSSSAPPPPLLLLVPRHPQRFDEVAQMLTQAGLHYVRRSALSSEELQGGSLPPQVQVLLGDSMGEMFAYYEACDLAFVGGSLLPLGGQNLIEACALGKPVLIGPHTFNFLEVTEQALAAGAACRVADAGALAEKSAQLLADDSARAQMGECGRAFSGKHRGATAKTLDLLQVWLE